MIVRTYKTNAEVEIGVELTANHQGYFEFRLCAHNMSNAPETDECFYRHLLIRADASADDVEGHRYFLKIVIIIFSNKIIKSRDCRVVCLSVSLVCATCCLCLLFLWISHSVLRVYFHWFT